MFAISFQALSYLHDLGLLLHFDDALLGLHNVYFMEPLHVYEVLNNFIYFLKAQIANESVSNKIHDRDIIM